MSFGYLKTLAIDAVLQQASTKAPDDAGCDRGTTLLPPPRGGGFAEDCRADDKLSR